MKNFLFTFLFLPLFGMTVYAQSKADKYVEEAAKLVESKQYKLANTKLQAAADIYKNEGNLSLYIKCVAEQGKNLSDNSQDIDAIKVLEALIRDAENFMKQPDENLALAHKYLGAVYYNNDDLLKATPYFKKALEMREKANPNSADLFRDNYNLGVMYRNMSNYAASIKFIGKAIELQKKTPNPAFLAKMYLQMGIAYRLLGAMSEAEDYIDVAIKYGEESLGKDSPELAVYLFEKGSAQKEAAISAEGIKKALQTLTKAQSMFEKKQEPDNYNYAACLENIGRVYLDGLESFRSEADKKASMEKAKGYFEKALAINKKIGGISEAISLANMAVVAANLNDFKNANKYCDDVQKIALKVLPEKHLTNAEFFSINADVFELNGDLTAALSKYSDAINAIIEGYSNKDLNTLPDWKLISEDKVLSLGKLNELIAKKARIYLKKYEQFKTPKDLELALSHVQLVDKIADKIRTDFVAEGGKMIVSDMIVDAYENAIAICLELAKAKKDPSFKEKAYYYSEKSKGLLLLEAFQSSKAGKMVGLSDAAVKEEENLRLSVSDLKQQIYQYKTRGEAQTDAAKQLEKELFAAKQAYATYVKRMERENPDYYNMKFNIKLLDVAQTRKLLKKDQALLEYFVGDKQIFVFKITATEFEVYSLPNNKNLAKTVKNFRESIYGYYLDAIERSDDAYEKYSNDYAKYGSELYETLLKPLGNLPKRLVIVPAGPLANMPFEPLLKQKPADGKLYKTHKYFGKDHIISYNYSATLLSEMINKKHSTNRETFLAFAPTFGGDAADGVTMRNRRFALAPLNYNTTEVQNVRKILGTGTVFIGKDAVEERFKSIGSNFQIVHFATHGMANDRDPDFSLLAFTEVPDSIENEFIYVSDLYNMQLNADLVVLSACETGLGELRKGEGVISLARGFSYAGAKGIFTTLWSVNDLATSLIIESFYKYLKQGKDKDEALYLAKMDFLSKADNQKAHPFLWAPFIFIGDTSPLEIKGGGMPWMFIGIAAAVVALLGLAFMMLKRKKESA